MKKIKYLILMLMMLFPMTTFALTVNKMPNSNGATKSKGGVTCTEYLSFDVPDPVVGEAPAEKATVKYKTPEHEDTKELRIVWYERNSPGFWDSYYDKLTEPVPFTGETFAKDKYYAWDFLTDDTLTEEEANDLSEFLEISNEFTCLDTYTQNNNVLLDKTYNAIYYLKAIDKDDKVVIDSAYPVGISNDLVFNSDEEFEGLVAEVKDSSLKLNLHLANINDEILFAVLVRNGTNEDAKIAPIHFEESNYIDYIVTFADDSDVIKAHSYKLIYINAKYKKLVSDELVATGYTESTQFNILVGNDALPDQANNPKTNISTAIIAIGLSAAIIIAVVRIGLKKKVKYLVLVLASLFVFVPFTVNAIKSVTLSVTSTITFEPSTVVDFKLDDKTYEAYLNMTFADWITSDFNTDHLEFIWMPNCETYENATNKEDFENKLALTFSKLTIAEEDYAIEASKKSVVETEAASIAYEPIITYTSYDEIVIHGGEQFNSVPTSVCMVEKERE